MNWLDDNAETLISGMRNKDISPLSKSQAAAFQEMVNVSLLLADAVRRDAPREECVDLSEQVAAFRKMAKGD